MGAVEIVARGRAGRRQAPACRRLLRSLQRATRRGDRGVTLLLAGDATVRSLNRRFRGQDHTTDVLAFPAGEDRTPEGRHLGDIVVSVPQAARQARRAGWSPAAEMALLVTHGFLHLLGYDHETDDGTMRRLEARLLQRVAHVRIDARRLPWGVTARRRRGAARARRD
jgi:probable rRNA maturation factor